MPLDDEQKQVLLERRRELEQEMSVAKANLRVAEESQHPDMLRQLAELHIQAVNDKLELLDWAAKELE